MLHALAKTEYIKNQIKTLTNKLNAKKNIQKTSQIPKTPKVLNFLKICPQPYQILRIFPNKDLTPSQFPSINSKI